MSDMNERVPDHFAKPEEAHGHETRFFGKFLGVGAVDSSFVVHVKGCREAGFEAEFSEHDGEAEESFNSENSGDSFSIAAGESNARLEFYAYGKNSAAPRDGVSEP